MASATVDQKYDSTPKAVEHVLVDTAEAATYVSKLGNPEFCQITIREDIDAIVSYTISGRTITFHESVGGGIKLAVSIYGKS